MGTPTATIFLTGASGQVGYELLPRLLTISNVVASAPDQPPRLEGARFVAMDLLDLSGLGQILEEVHPALIVNPAAYTNVEKAEDEVATASALNADAVGVMADYCRRSGAGFVHYSTDYVFDGSGDRPRRENEVTGPRNVYGRTKLLGEELLKASGCSYQVFRTSWVYGAHGHNFVKTMLKLGRDRDSLTVIDDQWGAPTSARQLAEITCEVLRQQLKAQGGWDSLFAGKEGPVHLTGSGVTTWYRFAEKIFAEALSLGWPLALRELSPVSSDQYKTKAERPRNSRLDLTLLKERYGIIPDTWEVTLAKELPAILATLS